MNKELKNKIDYINKEVGKKTGFSTPDNYFNNVDEDIFSTIKSISSSKDNNTFKTPDNYFYLVENNILSKLNITENKEVKVFSLRKKILNIIPFVAAASVLLFITLNYFNTNVEYNFEDITEADVTTWYENGYGSTNNNELAIVLETSDFDEDFLSSINDENIENYLNTFDNSTLLNEIQ